MSKVLMTDTEKEVKSIAFLVWFFPKLSETFILNQILELRKRGYEVTIYAIKDPRKILAKEDKELEMTVHEDIIKNDLLGITVYGSIDKLYSLIASKAKIGKLDMIYYQFPDLANEMMKIGSLPVPSVVTFHDIAKFSSEDERNFIKGKFEHVFKEATLILAISNFAKKELIKLGCDGSKIIVYHMGIKIDKFRLFSINNLDQSINFSMIGRFVEKKGLKYGIYAFSRFIKKYPSKNIYLNIIGDGILKNELIKQVDSLKIKDKVVFYGKLPQKGVLNVLKKTDVLICPSITTNDRKREGLPVVILEASACGIPVIASNHAAIPELLKSNEALLVKERSVTGLEIAMHKCLEDYSKYKKIAKETRCLVSQEYNIKYQIDLLTHIFNQSSQIYKRKQAFSNFTKYINKELRKRLCSVMVAGSVVRFEKVTKESDLDLIILFNKDRLITAEELRKTRKGIFDLQREIAIPIAPQIFDITDIFQLMSPVLMKSYSEDGIVLYGQNLRQIFRDKLSKVSTYRFDMSILKRCLFERYLLRQNIALYKGYCDSSLCYRLAKSVLFLVSDAIYIDYRKYFTSRREIASAAYNLYQEEFPIQASKVIENEGMTKFPKLFAKKAVNYIENVTDRIILTLRNKYKEREIYVSPF